MYIIDRYIPIVYIIELLPKYLNTILGIQCLGNEGVFISFKMSCF